jgi:diguanylate cyclase (GGDEF)-like protein/PAS domain S-box-containing protein
LTRNDYTPGDRPGQRVMVGDAAVAGRARDDSVRPGVPELDPLRSAEQASLDLREAATGRKRGEADRAHRAASGLMTLRQEPSTTPDGRQPLSRRPLLAYAIGNVTLAALYLLVPALGLLAWALIVLCALTAFGMGIARNRPRRRFPWVFLAAGYLTFAIGTLVAFSAAATFPSQADVVFLGVSLPLILLGLLSLTRSGARISDRASMIDAVILTTGAGFLAWTFLINPFLQNPDLSPLEKAVSIAYPMADVLMLAILARLGLTAARSRSATLLIVSGAALLTADVLYGLSRLNGDWHVGGPMDLGWLVFYIAGGAAALHPSMIVLTEPHVLNRTQVSLRRSVLTVASLLAPTALLIQALRGPVIDGLIIAAASAVLILLALARMSAVANSLRQTLTRERQLRLACEALLVSASTDQVSDVLCHAVGQMLPPGTPHQVALNVLEIEETSNDPGVIELRYVRSLPPNVVATLATFELALCCRLAVGGHQVGDLYVSADELALVGLQESLPILAGQAATMIDRITLNREISLRDSQAYFRTLVVNATEVIAIIGDDNRLTYASPAAELMFGTADLVGRTILDGVDPSQRDRVRVVLDAAREGRPSEGLNLWLVRRTDGDLIHAEVSIGDMRQEPGVNGLVVTLRDVTQRQRLEQELITRAYLDPVTGLGNRLQFQDDVAAAQADRADGVCGVMIINIDDFRVVNDTMGHEVGDELLIAVAKRLSEVLAGNGTVARLGADEFGAVIEDAPDIAHIERLAEQAIDASAQPFHVGGSVVTVHLRAGVATTAHASTPKELLSQADVALDAARASTERWRRYEASLHAQVIDRMQLRTDLDQAYADGAFLLHYQPIVDLQTRRTVGFEALLRWPHPTRGMIPPATFIPVAEESGLIVPLGAWILRTAVAAAAGWRQLSPEMPYVSVNVSVRQFRAPLFVEQVLAELAHFDLPPHLLTLEITESLLLGEQEEIKSDIVRLRQAGIKVSIDDFGTGYSSLSYLHRVPIDTLKLDKSFVDTITTSGQQLALVTGILQLAETLDLDVVAEGVETSAEHHLLCEAGCALGQGYLFARPMIEEDARRRIADEATTA